MDTESTVRRVIEAYDRQDADAVGALLSDELRYRINARPETGRYCATTEGKADFFAAIQPILDDWEVASYKLGDLIVSGERAAAQVDLTLRSRHRADHVFVGNLALFLTVVEGKITEIVEYHDTASAKTARTGW